MDEQAWVRWLLQTSSKWEDIEHVVKKTGISEVDEDHKILAKYAIDLNNAISKVERNEFSVSDIEAEYLLLKRFQNYAIDHFKREEELIIKYNIDGLDIQQTQHKKILDKVEATVQSFRSGKIMVSLSLKLELLDWIVDHINVIDYSIFSPENFRRSISLARNWEDLKVFFQGTGISFIDEEHSEIINTILEFSNKASEGTPKEHISIFDQMIEQVVEHFNGEEKFIREHHLPNLNVQIRSHKMFLDLLLSHRKSLLIDPDVSIDNLRFELVIWWVRHTTRVDRSSLALENWTEQVFKNTKQLSDIEWLINKTGNEQVDYEHLNVVKLALELFEHSEGTINSSDLLASFTKLEDAVRSHFIAEEQTLKKLEYNQFEAHHVEHEQILSWFASLRSSIETGSFKFNRDIKVKLLEWWISHTNYVDYLAFTDNSFKRGIGEQIN